MELDAIIGEAEREVDYQIRNENYITEQISIEEVLRGMHKFKIENPETITRWQLEDADKYEDWIRCGNFKVDSVNSNMKPKTKNIFGDKNKCNNHEEIEKMFSNCSGYSNNSFIENLREFYDKNGYLTKKQLVYLKKYSEIVW